jgi:hypothetical protein
MKKLTKETLIETYKLTLNEEQFSTNLFESRLAFYTGVLSTIMTAIVIGVYYANTAKEFLVLLFGPIIMIFVASIGIHSAKRATSRISRILTVKAKIEQALGLTIYHKYPGEAADLYWEKEPIIDLDHIESRKVHSKSTEFSKVFRESNKSYSSGIIRLYKFFIGVGVVCEIFILWLARNAIIK